jgi:hypothetical protein
VTTDAQGHARTTWVLGLTAGPQALAARVDALPAATMDVRAVAVSSTVLEMLRVLDSHIRSWRDGLRRDLPNNPHVAGWMQAKLAMLDAPGLASAIVRGRHWVEDSVRVTSGSVVPVAAIFPLDSLRGEAARSARTVASGIPTLEALTGVAFPAPAVLIWDGFVIGNAGGGGSLHMEDRATYEARTGSTRSPYDALLLHEAAHTWFGNEAVTQFLELYAYNVPRTGVRDARAWAYTRGWTPGAEGNEGVHAVLDVYELLGPDAMTRALRAAQALRPRYNQPLAPEVRQLFADEAPPAVRAQVLAKLATIRA